MKKITFILLSFLIFYVPGIFATPPTSITLTYDQAKGNLHVEAGHPSFDLVKSYVRLMNVYVNGEEVLTQDYYRQDAYDKFTDDVSVTAQIGDVIKVDLFCSLGGEMAQELTVAPPTAGPSGQGSEATDNSQTNSATNSVTNSATNGTKEVTDNSAASNSAN